MRALLVALSLMMLAGPGCESDDGCRDDYDCPAAQVCRKASGACELVQCGEGKACPGGDVCRDNRCESPVR